MEYEHPFNEKERELIKALYQKEPDYALAEQLIAKGANLNAKENGEKYRDNLLSYLLFLAFEDVCFSDDMSDKEIVAANNKVGELMGDLIDFFLAHGFDVTLEDDHYGASCLYEIALCAPKDFIIPLTKKLLNAGAKDGYPYVDDDYETVSQWVDFDASFRLLEDEPKRAMALEACYHLLIASSNGLPYQGIDCCMTAIGKTLEKVLIDSQGKEPFFKVDLPESKHENCFNDDLYLLFSDGTHLHYGENPEMWFDTAALPASLLDVTDRFSALVGRIITDIQLIPHGITKGKTTYGQDTFIIKTNNNTALELRVNFGKVEREDSCAYYTILDEDNDDKDSTGP